MNPVKIHSVTLNKFAPGQLHGQRLAYLVGEQLHFGSEEMYVEKSFDEPGKHVVSLTFVIGSDAKPDAPAESVNINKVTLGQNTVDKIQAADDTTEYGRRSKMFRCGFFVLVDIFHQEH